jgi:hypothetical protein
MQNLVIFRGILHLNLAIILPFVTYVISSVTTPLQNEYIWKIFLLTEFQLVASATLHTAYNDSILAQVIDHCAVFTSGYLLQIVLSYYGHVPFKDITLVVVCVAIIQKVLYLDGQFNRVDRVLVTLEGLLYLGNILVMDFPSYHARDMSILTALICLIMFTIYNLQWPKSTNQIYGYHEVIHTMSLVIIIYNYLAILMH